LTLPSHLDCRRALVLDALHEIHEWMPTYARAFNQTDGSHRRFYNYRRRIRQRDQAAQ